MERLLGYACINTALKSQGVYTNRTIKRAKFDSLGLQEVSRLALLNVQDLFKIIKWNESNGIKLFRISSDLFPWCTEYNLEDLPDWREIQTLLESIGSFCNHHSHRLSFHPGAFNILCSPKQDVVRNTVNEVSFASSVLSAMGLEESRKHKVNIHIGGAYGDKDSTLSTWISRFDLFSDCAKSRITIENDDRKSLYTVQDLIRVYENTGCSIVFDFHHFNCHNNNHDLYSSLSLALSTWDDSIIPMTHFSSSRKIYEDESCKNTAHADYIYDPIPDFSDLKYHIMLECKAKENALLRYVNTRNHNYLFS